LIFSVTDRCNLFCKGCYSRNLEHRKGDELTTGEIIRIISDAEKLGISIVLLAGGEPLTRPDLHTIAAANPGVLFPVFTNGYLMDQNRVVEFARNKNMIPFFSVEGDESMTDGRRGAGTYRKITDAIALARKSRLFWGVSITVNHDNFSTVIGKGYARDLIGKGCRAFIFVEYVPAENGTDANVLNDDERKELIRHVDWCNRNLDSLFTAFPGSEEEFGGCLAAGRGFFHINPYGFAEPCPFAPYSEMNLKHFSVEQVIRSPLFRLIQENHEKLKETKGGCALFENKEWLRNELQHLSGKPQ
jgi:MoaA/NifB/PqqE/SkfB family radical SAM enzyme